MNELQVFTNEELGKVRVIKINNEPWFVGKDVAKILGYTNSSDALKKHIDEEDKQVILKSQFATLEIPNRGMTMINESGLYSLILSSKLLSAKKFKRWVTSEVLPQIRETGAYIPSSQLTKKEQLLLKLFSKDPMEVAKAHEQLVELEKKPLLETIEIQKPKVNYFDTFMNSQGCYTSTQVAKLFKLSSARKLNTILNENKIIYKQGDNWLPYSTTNKEWFKVTIGEKNTHNYSQLKFTPKGIYELSKLLNITLKEEDLKQL